MEENNTVYNHDWFEKRAVSSFKKIGQEKWDYSDSLLLYISSIGSETYEKLQEENSLYFKLVTKPEREYLASIAKNIAEMLPERFEYIDLGPGTEHKEQFLFDELKKLNKVFTYVPVDISQYYLNLAEGYASKQNISVNPIRSSFEELSYKLGTPTIPRFISIGLTFSNYNPQEILNLLKEIGGENTYLFINTQIRNRVDMQELQKVYAKDAEHMCDEKLQLLGFNLDTDVSSREANEGIEVRCSVLKVNSQTEKLGITIGDSILLFQSLRYSEEVLEQELKKFSKSYTILDTGSSFLGSIIRT